MYEYFPTFSRLWNGLIDGGIWLCGKGVAFCDRQIAASQKRQEERAAIEN
jgi:hypothetical protein